ncbi:MAG: hypothetical protein IK003_06390 [Prevotella sp.]|nr:hypothetical protein [Prevotella sp.]
MKRLFSITLTVFLSLGVFASPLSPEEGGESPIFGGPHDKPSKVSGIGSDVKALVSGNSLIIISRTPLERGNILIYRNGSNTIPYSKMIYMPTQITIITLPQDVVDHMIYGILTYRNGSAAF